MATPTAAAATAVEGESSPEAIVAWTLRRFKDREVVVTTRSGWRAAPSSTWWRSTGETSG
jgi:hypothetical protein